VAILAAGIALLTTSAHVPGAVAIVVFAVGVSSASVSILANRTQHDYYKNARDLKRDLEGRLGLGDLAIATTAGMGGLRGRIARVTTLQMLVLSALLVADLTGLGAAIEHSCRSAPPSKVEVAVRVLVRHRTVARRVPLVLSRDGRIQATATLRPGEMAILRLRPGGYKVATLAGRLCASRASITDAPLQSIVIRCP
jgi:hypothetical protein